MAREQAITKGEAPTELAEAERRLTIDPADADALATQSESLLSLERWQEGLEAADRLLLVQPELELGHRLRFVALCNLSRGAEAVEAARAAIRLQPGNANGHYLLASELFRQNRDEETLASAERAVELDPEVPLYWSLLGRVVFFRDPARAEALLGKTVKAQPDNAAALNDLGVLVELRDFQAARAHYVDAIRADPRLEEAQHNLSRVAWWGLPWRVRQALMLLVLTMGVTGMGVALWSLVSGRWANFFVGLAGVIAGSAGFASIHTQARACRQPRRITFQAQQ